ncbi:hypothetical protein DM02DRAFT_28616 [Periconia macrospinosa]|uniref:Uncharacterized protein n=1 Tax=Periconia macrospinosa TaxID=97972 RepID=A0A2V1DLB0_9PLEO|nr:hypothetical protein DM02DRAFT_28616 [Periconia macrospinosa]
MLSSSELSFPAADWKKSLRSSKRPGSDSEKLDSFEYASQTGRSKNSRRRVKNCFCFSGWLANMCSILRRRAPGHITDFFAMRDPWADSVSGISEGMPESAWGCDVSSVETSAGASRFSPRRTGRNWSIVTCSGRLSVSGLVSELFGNLSYDTLTFLKVTISPPTGFAAFTRFLLSE